jgi:uncharacterized Zn-finger protein
MIINSVMMPLDVSVPVIYRTGLILERNCKNVVSVGKFSFLPVSSKDINEFTREGNPMYVRNMGKPLFSLNSFRHLKPYAYKHCGKTFADSSSLLTHESSHMREKPFVCKSCGKLSLIPVPSDFMQWYTVERNPTVLNNVEEPLLVLCLY